MIDKQHIQNNINELKTLLGSREQKYRRNYRRYCNTPFISLDTIREQTTVGYYTDDSANQEQDTNQAPQLNVIKSCIDTLTSKIAESKVRPFFNTVNGSYKDIQVVKQAQQYFDMFYDQVGINKTVSEAFRDACIFDTGVVFIDPIAKDVKKALPWQVFYRPAEQTYGKLTRVYYEQKDYPVTLLPKELSDKLPKRFNAEYVTYGIYFDNFNKVQCYSLPEYDIYVTKDYESDTLPFVFIHYNAPVKGASSLSIVDTLNTIQIEIDTLMTKISDASQLNPALTFFVPTDSGVKEGTLSNGVGNVVSYRASPNMTSSPVTVATPNFIDTQYQTLLEMLIQKAYEMIGISQLSAMSSKPKGLNSGVALGTMEDIEGDRFETQLNQVIHAYVDIAKACIQNFDQNEDVLPVKEDRLSIKWKDIIKESKEMTIQYSQADALSKDPSTKLQQLQALAQVGVIPATRIAQFMEIPDIESGYNLTNNAINAIMEIINDCLDNDNFDLPDYIPFSMLKEEIISTQLSFKAANNKNNKEAIEKLDKLYKIAEKKEKEWNTPVQSPEQQKTDSGMPATQNVLTQEANTTQANEAPNMPQTDLNMDTNDTGNQSWNTQPRK